MIYSRGLRTPFFMEDEELMGETDIEREFLEWLLEDYDEDGPEYDDECL